MEAVVSASRPDLTPAPPAVTQTRRLTPGQAESIQSPTATDIAHDPNGNVTDDGRWTYAWDAERRPVVMEERFIGLPGETQVPVRRLEMVYDAQGRRVSKKLMTNVRNADGTLVNATWAFQRETIFLWQDWMLLAEFVRVPDPVTQTISSPALRRSYLWGLDVSGTLEGAGGVGGLLWVADHVPGIAGGASTRQLAPCYDGNGNILSWVENEGAELLPLHRLENDPFGQTLVDDPARVARTKKQRDLGVPDEWLDRPAFGFSTKYEDRETGLLYYGYRYYNPELGRWMSWDPIYEITGIHPEFLEEGPNLYGFVHNDPINGYDFLGLKWRKVGKTKDKRRLIWERESPTKDTFEELAKKVDLDPQEASRWAKPDKENSCRYTTPNVWIMVKMLRGIHGFRDIYTNPGDEIGDMFTFTGDRKTVNVSTSGAIVSTINQYRGDIIGLSIYGHGDVGIVGGTGGDFEYANDILSAVDGNGFKLKEAHLMQCYSGAGGFDEEWKARCYKGRAKVYYGVNFCGFETGSKPNPLQR